MIIKLRNLIEDDCVLLFKWANNGDVRKNALNPQKISWEQHELWFKNKICSPNSKIFILEKDNLPIGQIRYDRKESGFWDIDFFIDQQFRGLGLGKKILELSLNNISGPFRALVKRENVASRKVFEKLGFRMEENEGGIIQYLLR